jgi:hypothetical protein
MSVKCGMEECKNLATKRVALRVKALTSGEKMLLLLKVYSCDKHATPFTAKRVMDDPATRRSIQTSLLKRGVSMVSWEDSEAGWANAP